MKLEVSAENLCIAELWKEDELRKQRRTRKGIDFLEDGKGGRGRIGRSSRENGILTERSLRTDLVHRYEHMIFWVQLRFYKMIQKINYS